MTRGLYIIFILNAKLALILSEWVEITQTPAVTPHNNSPALKNSELNDDNGLSKLRSEDNVLSATTPSPEWVAYQRERFQQQNSSPHKLVVSSGNHLQKSARIMVPGSHRAQDTPIQTEKTNKLIHAINKMEINDNKFDEKVLHGEPQVASPKRRKTSTNAERESVRNDNAYREETEDRDNQYFDSEGEAEEPKNSFENPLEYPSIQGFIKFIKAIQKSLLRKTGLSIGSKIKLLKDMRDKFMRAIEERFMMLWQPVERKRSKRGLLDESSLSFPPDAALMSINFLTFAVFLIKLVLQVVQIVRSKHYSFTGFGVNSIPISKTTLRS